MGIKVGILHYSYEDKGLSLPCQILNNSHLVWASTLIIYSRTNTNGGFKVILIRGTANPKESVEAGTYDAMQGMLDLLRKDSTFNRKFYSSYKKNVFLSSLIILASQTLKEPG